MALTAFAGPGNGGLFLLARSLVTKPWFRPAAGGGQLPVLATAHEPGQSLRLRADARLYGDGEVHHFVPGSGINPWLIYVVGGYPVPWAIVDFSRTMLLLGLALSGFFTPTSRAVTFVVATVLSKPDMASQLIARTSVMVIPPVLICSGIVS